MIAHTHISRALQQKYKILRNITELTGKSLPEFAIKRFDVSTPRSFPFSSFNCKTENVYKRIETRGQTVTAPIMHLFYYLSYNLN